MMGLDSLPVELLNWILSHLDDPSDLLNLSQTSKFIRKCVEPFLYCSYINTTIETRSLVSFIRRIVEEPSLVQHTKKVEVGMWDTKRRIISPDLDFEPQTIPDSDFHFLVNAAKQAGLVESSQNQNPDSLRPIVKDLDKYYEYGSDYDTDAYDSDTEGQYAIHPDEAEGGNYHDVQLLRCLKYGIEDAQLILLLSLLPRLEELLLKGVPEGMRLSWEKLASVPHGFSALRKIHASDADGEVAWELWYLKPFLALPSMRELKAYMATSSGEENLAELFDYEPKSLSLTRIHLEHCIIDAITIENILKGCKSLESFTFTVIGDRPGGDDWDGILPQFTASQLRAALLSQKDTLKDFTLDFSDWSFEHDFGTFGSLAEFKVLERLTIDYATLRWHPHNEFEEIGGNNDEIHRANTEPPLPELLPKSLKFLNILWAPPVIVPNLVQFGRTPREEFPNLTSVDVTMFELDYTRRKVPDYGIMKNTLKDLDIAYVERSQCGKLPTPSTMMAWLVEPNIITWWKRESSKYESKRRKTYLQSCLEFQPKCPHMGEHGPDIDCFAQEWQSEGWANYAESIPDDSEEGEYFFEFEHRPRGLPWIFGDMSDPDDEEEEGDSEDYSDDEDENDLEDDSVDDDDGVD